MHNYKSSSLFHYTKSNESLFSILKHGFLPTYNIEEFHYETLEERSPELIGIPMVCFCDIPLSCAEEHTKQYGEYALAFSKKWAIKNRINPLLYVMNDSILGMIDLLKESANMVSSHNKQTNCWLRCYMERYEVARMELLAFTKTAPNYKENEWRYILHPQGISSSLDVWSNTNPWISGHKAQLLKNDDKLRLKESKKLQTNPLRFSCHDIKWIIVPNEQEIVKCCEKLRRTRHICGKIITKEDRTILYTRIVSLERIRSDF